MKLSRLIGVSIIAAMLVSIAPQAPASADGAASTRNIILGGAAAALIIINHNKQVHAKYAQDAANEAALAEQRDNAQAAYASEKKAFDNESALVADLKREVAYQHDQVDQLRRQVAMLQPHGATTGGQPSNFVAQTTLVHPTPVGGEQQVAVTSYGWGSI
jgi:hypothetical protein